MREEKEEKRKWKLEKEEGRGREHQGDAEVTHMTESRLTPPDEVQLRHRRAEKEMPSDPRSRYQTRG
ncbi:TPM_phosphatase domain-containing protein [Psidium guajava]|nr:TPM_phosphatase domain-containing protein [Psidium guajava]